MQQKIFGAKDVERILGVDKFMLYHWWKSRGLTKPKKIGRGHGGRSEFTFTNILELGLVRELHTFGVEVNSIEAILKGAGMKFDQDGTLRRGRSPWEIFKSGRETYTKKRKKLVIEISKINEHYYWEYWSGREFVEGFLEKGVAPITKLAINLSNLILEIEKKSGCRL